MSMKRLEECKRAARDLNDYMESRSIAICSCGAKWLEDESDYFIELTLHVSEKNKNYDLPKSSQGFQVRCEYEEYAQFAQLP